MYPDPGSAIARPDLPVPCVRDRFATPILAVTEAPASGVALVQVSSACALSVVEEPFAKMVSWQLILLQRTSVIRAQFTCYLIQF